MIQIAKDLAEDVCPYCDYNTDECKASVKSLKIGELLRLNRCNNETYDNCSLFLAKCLRSTRQYRYAS
jgi:hypothetical protein